MDYTVIITDIWPHFDTVQFVLTPNHNDSGFVFTPRNSSCSLSHAHEEDVIPKGQTVEQPQPTVIYYPMRKSFIPTRGLMRATCTECAFTLVIPEIHSYEAGLRMYFESYERDADTDNPFVEALAKAFARKNRKYTR